MTDGFKVIFGFYRTNSDTKEVSFASMTLGEEDKQSIEIDGTTLVLSTEGGIASCDEKVVHGDVLKDPESEEVLRARTKVADGIYCQATAQEPKLAVRVHPEGKTCGECILWSREKGIEVLNTVHKKFQDDMDLKLYKEVIDQVADNHGLPMLDDKNIGYCPKESSLSGDKTPACEGFKNK